jgi:septal ring factor EnvC (AmiA/AmiB activator)
MLDDEAKTAPVYRSVEAQSGAVAPVSMAAALVILDHLTKDRDALVEKVQEALTQRDNLVNLTIEVGQLGAYLKDVLAERDDAERECDELRDQLEAARCRLDELEGAARQRADDL